MWNLLQDELGGGIGPRLLVALVDTGAKGLILMAAAGLAAVAMRRNAAAARHLVWLLALCGLLLLPIVSLMMPKWTLPILPALEAPASPAIATPLPPIPAAQPTPSNFMPPPAEAFAPNRLNATPMPAPQPAPSMPLNATPPKPAPNPVNLPAWALTLWLTGALLAIAPFIAGIIAVARLRRRADTFADSDLQPLAAYLAQTLALKHPAGLWRKHAIHCPCLRRLHSARASKGRHTGLRPATGQRRSDSPSHGHARPSIDPEDLFHTHIGAMDAFARGLKSAANMIKNGKFEKAIKKRYTDWDTAFGKSIESGRATLEDLEAYTFKNGDPEPQSGRQEYLENLLNGYIV